MKRVSSNRIHLAWAATLAIALLALGAAAHFEHHLLAPDCESGGPTSHPCASCSVLHGGTLAEVGVAAAPPAPSHTTDPSHREKLAPVGSAPACCAPRAPPLG